jgi:hypothetical protein
VGQNKVRGDAAPVELFNPFYLFRPQSVQVAVNPLDGFFSLSFLAVANGIPRPILPASGYGGPVLKTGALPPPRFTQFYLNLCGLTFFSMVSRKLDQEFV